MCHLCCIHPEFPNIRGADILSQEVINITPDQLLDYNWNDHGFGIHIPAGAINYSSPLTMFIQASLSGDYQLPNNGTFVSGVYSLCFDTPLNNFTQKITISVEHCASDVDSRLSFVTADVTEETPPYLFKLLPGGLFSTPGVGSIEVEHFTWFSVMQILGKVKYALCTHYIRKQTNHYEVHITVTQNLDLQLKVGRLIIFDLLLIFQVQAVKNEYQGTEKGPTGTVTIQENEISLNFKPHSDIPEGSWEKNGWELNLLVKPPKVRSKIVSCNCKSFQSLKHMT